MTLVEQTNPFDTGMMDEIPRWRNPRTGKMEPVDGYPGPVHEGGFQPIGTYDPNNPAKAEPIGTYDPRFPPQVVPLDFLNNFLDEGLLAKGKSPFSTPYWDKQDDIRKYLDNIRRLKERGLLGGLPKA
tara:strand:+ start:210 stop:593 length:384 start_codon:yes stop_codon:yes gene_type:complete